MNFIRFFLVISLMMTIISGPSLFALESPLNWRSLISKAESESVDVQGKAGYAVQKGEFEIYSEELIERKVTCQYAYIPRTEGISGSKRIDPVVFYFHTPGDKNPLENNICERLSRTCGFTIFTIVFTDSSAMKLYYDEATKRKFYAYDSSGSFAAIKSAWETLKSKFNINSSSFYLYGYSAGAIGAQRFSETYPELCAGVAIVCGHSYCEKKTAKCPILLISTYGDSGSDDTEGLVKYYRRNATPCISLYFSPNWNLLKEGQAYSFHAVHPLVAPLVQFFFESMAYSRNRNANGTVDFPAMVQFVANASDPRQIWSARTTGIIDSIKAFGGDPIYVPTARFYGEMIKNSPPLVVVNEGNELGIYSVPPQHLTADSIVAIKWTSLIQDSGGKTQTDYGVINTLKCDARYIADMGMYAVASYDDAAVLRSTQELLERQHPDAKSLPVKMLVIDPKKDELLLAVSLPRVSSVTIIASTPYELTVILPILDSMIRKGLRVDAIVCVNEEVDYRNFITSNKLQDRELFFHFAIWPDKFEHSMRNVAVHQRVLDLAVSVLSNKAHDH